MDMTQRTIEIALVTGDGSAPEMMQEATEIAIVAARQDGAGVAPAHVPALRQRQGTGP